MASDPALLDPGLLVPGLRVPGLGRAGLGVSGSVAAAPLPATSAGAADRSRLGAPAGMLPQLLQQNGELRAVLDGIGIGIAAWDVAASLTFSNARFLELFALEPGSVLPGLSLADFTCLAVEAGTLEARDAGELRAVAARLFARGEAVSFVQRLAGGQLLNVSFTPLDHGWLTSYEDVTKRERAQVRLAFQAQHDPLTKLANRARLHERLSHALGRPGAVALLCVDLDRCGTLSESVGQHGGDALLRSVAARLTNGQRQSDTVARLGGDQFAILLGTTATQAEVAIAAERVLRTLALPFEIDGRSFTVGAGIGIAMSPRDGRDPQALLQAANRAGQVARAAGPNTWRFFDRELEALASERAALERDLRLALRKGEIEMFYQPLLRLSTRAVSGFEALMRWRHPTRGMVQPSQFIALAESCGEISELGRFALERACRDAMTWPAHLRVAVNLSPAQIGAGDVISMVRAALAQSGLPPGRLELEVTEAILIRDEIATGAVLQGLKELGVRIAMDDFGTGYSSLSYIQKFPFDKIKIDKSFINGIGHEPAPAVIVSAVIDIAASLGIETVAEGVETRQQFERLVAKRCDHVQGFLFSRARPTTLVRRMVTVIDAQMSRAP